MGVSLAFHIVFASLGVGIPLLMFAAEGIGYFKRDKTWYDLARRWSRAFAILYAIGAVSGTILSFELGLLWPTFMRFSGAVIGLPFALEAFAFFVEAIFLGIYIYGWNRLPPLWHWLASIPLFVGGLFSALFVVTANAWMNTPAGFQYVNGKVIGIDPLGAMFNPSTPSETMHMLFAAYAATGAGTAMVYALALLRGQRDTYNRRGLLLGMAMAAIAAPIVGFFGDVNARVVAHYQPAKFAAMEGLFQTTHHAPETILGWPDPATRQTYFAIKIPGLDSWLAFGDVNATVTGLDAFSPSLWPDPRIVHLAFDIMVGIGFLAFGLGIWFWYRYFVRRSRAMDSRWLLWLIAAMGPLSFLAIELGWTTTEMGRQPWVVYGYLLTKDAVTPAPGLDISFLVFTAIYIALGVATTVFLLRLRRTARDTPAPRARGVGLGGLQPAEGDA
jgi:cytochrome d ubiquinol oxidase subunit I